jgi:prepilin-type processing-associated H-X9-DG protein
MRATGYANYLFADGHVELIPGQVIKTWADQGINFALPKSLPRCPMIARQSLMGQFLLTEYTRKHP